MLEDVVAVLGPPATGKTTLTTLLGAGPGRSVFRLRDHVPQAILAATATSADRLGWIDDVTVARALRGYLEAAAADADVRVVLMDNFPGSATQAMLLLSALRALAPACAVGVVELAAETATVRRRIRDRRVCHQCERDPIGDPRLPAEASPGDPRRCARCGSVLHPRRGDAPRLVAARTRRYETAIIGIRHAFASAGVGVWQLDSNHPTERTAADLSRLLTIRSTSP